jgi:hypothetical protein
VDGNRPDLIASKAGRKGSYGIDAPRLLPVLGLFFIANIVQGVISGKLWPFLGAAVILGCAGRAFMRHVGASFWFGRNCSTNASCAVMSESLISGAADIV